MTYSVLKVPLNPNQPTNLTSLMTQYVHYCSKAALLVLDSRLVLETRFLFEQCC